MDGLIGVTLQRAVENGHLREWHRDAEGKWRVTIADNAMGDRAFTMNDDLIVAFCHGLLAAS